MYCKQVCFQVSNLDVREAATKFLEEVQRKAAEEIATANAAKEAEAKRREEAERKAAQDVAAAEEAQLELLFLLFFVLQDSSSRPTRLSI